MILRPERSCNKFRQANIVADGKTRGRRPCSFLRGKGTLWRTGAGKVATALRAERRALEATLAPFTSPYADGGGKHRHRQLSADEYGDAGRAGDMDEKETKRTGIRLFLSCIPLRKSDRRMPSFSESRGSAVERTLPTDNFPALRSRDRRRTKGAQRRLKRPLRRLRIQMSDSPRQSLRPCKKEAFAW